MDLGALGPYMVCPLRGKRIVRGLELSRGSGKEMGS